VASSLCDTKKNQKISFCSNDRIPLRNIEILGNQNDDHTEFINDLAKERTRAFIRLIRITGIAIRRKLLNGSHGSHEEILSTRNNEKGKN